MYLRKINILLLVLFSSYLTACGGGSSNSNDSNINVEGTLVVPSTTEVTAQRIIRNDSEKSLTTLAARDVCPDVPAGYEPLKNVTVEFLDNTNTALSNTTTDECGKFSASISDDVTTVKALSAGNEDLVTTVSVFKTSNSNTVASTIPLGAQYQISSIQITSDDSIAFSVTDTLTNNAVIGMPDTALSVQVNDSDLPISNLSSAANTIDPASITLVMDASGSMTDFVVDENNDLLVDPIDSSNYTRFRMASIAAHTYLDNTPDTDETAFTIFDHEVNFITDTTLSNLINYVSSAPGAATDTVEYQFATDGFTNKASDLRLIVDSYSPETEVFTSFGTYGTPPGPIRRHSDSPELKAFSSFYPWLGSTAAYDAIYTSLEETDSRDNERKIVIAMTDGEDNFSGKTANDVVISANAKSIPVHTIGFGTDESANDSLKQIADETNATFFKVTGTDLVSVFQSIQTGITFQYVTELSNSIEVGDTVKLTINIDGNEVTREITR